MSEQTMAPAAGRLRLRAATAADIMAEVTSPLRDTATCAEALLALSRAGCNALPVTDARGFLVGVLSRVDLLVHERERAAGGDKEVDHTLVRDMMMPAVFSVRPETPVVQAMEQMLSWDVQQLFVVDHQGTLRGVVEALGILRQLIVEDGAVQV